jgi:hypothetical protein
MNATPKSMKWVTSPYVFKVIRTGFLRGSDRFDFSGRVGLILVSVVRLHLGWRELVQLAVDALFVEPRDPLAGLELEVVVLASPPRAITRHVATMMLPRRSAWSTILGIAFQLLASNPRHRAPWTT